MRRNMRKHDFKKNKIVPIQQRFIEDKQWNNHEKTSSPSNIVNHRNPQGASLFSADHTNNDQTNRAAGANERS